MNPFRAARLLSLCAVCFFLVDGPGPDGRVLDPAVAALLEINVAGEATLTFTQHLEWLAKKQGWHDQLIETTNLAPLGRCDEAHAVQFRSGRRLYIVVILRSWSPFIPGSDEQTLILLDKQGNYLDHLACSISNRLTRWVSGNTYHTTVFQRPERDGAQLAIRLDGDSVRGNWSQNIYHGAWTQYYWGGDQLAREQPTKWDTNGLCRIAIKNGKFVVLFPGEAELKRDS